MKTVPKLRMVAHDDASRIDLPDLPEEVRLALAGVAGVAREGLLAMSVAAGVAVMQAMFDAEITAACGLKGRHDPGRAAARHGTGRGPVGVRWCSVHQPVAVGTAGGEVGGEVTWINVGDRGHKGRPSAAIPRRYTPRPIVGAEEVVTSPTLTAAPSWVGGEEGPRSSHLGPQGREIGTEWRKWAEGSVCQMNARNHATPPADDVVDATVDAGTVAAASSESSSARTGSNFS